MTTSEIISNETFRTIAEQAARLPGSPAASTVWRWTVDGVRGIRLDAVRIGWRTYVSDEAVERFLSAINASDPTRQATHRGRELVSAGS